MKENKIEIKVSVRKREADWIQWTPSLLHHKSSFWYMQICSLHIIAHLYRHPLIGSVWVRCPFVSEAREKWRMEFHHTFWCCTKWSDHVLPGVTVVHECGKEVPLQRLEQRRRMCDGARFSGVVVLGVRWKVVVSWLSFLFSFVSILVLSRCAGRGSSFGSSCCGVLDLVYGDLFLVLLFPCLNSRLGLA